MKSSNQALQKQQSRSVDSANRRPSLLKRPDPVKKHLNIVKKSLNSAFIDVSGDITPEKIDSSPESDILDEQWLSESISSETSRPSDFASLMDAIEDKQYGEITEDFKGYSELESLKSRNIVQEAPFHVSNALDSNLQTKMILEALIKEVLAYEFSMFHQNRDQFADLTSEKVRIGFIGFFLWMIVVISIVFVSKFGSQNSIFGLPPT